MMNFCSINFKQYLQSVITNVVKKVEIKKSFKKNKLK